MKGMYAVSIPLNSGLRADGTIDAVKLGALVSIPLNSGLRADRGGGDGTKRGNSLNPFEFRASC